MDAVKALKGFGTRVRDFRRAVGMSQEKLAEKIDVSRETVSSIERGQKFCTFDTLVRLAESLSVNIDDLFSGTPRVRKSPSDLAVDQAVKRLREMLTAGATVTADDVIDFLNTSGRIQHMKRAAKSEKRRKG